MIQSIINGFSLILQPTIIVLNLIGVAFGLIMGALPGLSTTMAIALALPITFAMDPIPAMSLLMGIFTGGVAGGLVSAILINIPGTPASVATTFDGYPMAKNGQAQRALGTAMLSKFAGQLLGIVVLIAIAPPVARFALKFGAFELFALTLASLTLIVTLSEGNQAKGFLSGLLGLILCLVGNAPIDGLPRYTFGFQELNAGFGILPFLIGLFGISEVLKNAEKSRSAEKKDVKIQVESLKGFGISLIELFRQGVNIIISTTIGVIIGILPGIGSGTSNVLAYMVEKKRSKYPEKFGTGIIDGIVASEAGGGGAIGGTMIPMLTLGIPGDAVTAMVLGGLMLHGLQPGPLLFVNNADVVNSIFASLLLGNLFMLVLCYFGIKLFVKVLRIPEHYLYPAIFVLCALGAFGASSRVFDVSAMILFGIIGFLMVKFDMPNTPIILGFMLGSMNETNLRRGLMRTDGSFLAFFESPVAAALIVVAVISVLYPFVKKFIMRSKAKKAEDNPQGETVVLNK